jgi:MoaA/NifB/PqqE/SkfB family radical SAM enzyme
VVGWSVTNRCNLRCAHCRVWSRPATELDTGAALELVDGMARAGVRVLGLTGGEALVRADLGRLVRAALDRGIQVGLNTNGILVPDRIDELSGISILKVSVDGPEPIHDAIRGRGSFRRAVAALDLARARGIGIEVAATITSAGAPRVGDLIDLARSLGAALTFQPALASRLGSADPNPLTCAREAFRQALAVLAEDRRRPGSPVRTSGSVLRHFARWPDAAPVACAGGRVACRVDPGGDVFHCGRVRLQLPRRNALSDGFLPAFEGLPEIACSQCWCAPRLEMNFLFDGHPDVWLGMAARVLARRLATGRRR